MELVFALYFFHQVNGDFMYTYLFFTSYLPNDVAGEFSLHGRFRPHEFGELLTLSSFVLFSTGNQGDCEFPIAGVNT